MTKTIHLGISRKCKTVLLPLAFMTISAVSFAGEHVVNPKAVMVTRNLNNKKHKVKLFTASDDKTLLFTVDGMDGKDYSLFVFDAEGKLMMQSVIHNQEISILPEITTGNYQYEVLAGDKKIESGQLKIK